MRFGSTAVMASGLVSLDLYDRGWETASRLVLAVAIAAWLWAVATGELAQCLTGVAATAALGARLAVLGWRAAVWASLAIAAVLWARQLPAVLRPPRERSGAIFLATVATQSLAILATLLGGRLPGLVLLVGGLALYVRALQGFDARELRHGTGDQWIAGGALAISALACAELGERIPSLVLWACAMAWLPALLAGELLGPRRAGSPDRWSTAFPVGMYAAMSFAVGRLAGLGWLVIFARAWAVVAVAVWALVLVERG